MHRRSLEIVLGADNRDAEGVEGEGYGERRNLGRLGSVVMSPSGAPGRKRVLVYLELEKQT